LNNTQVCNIDPSATTNALIQNVGGKVSLTTAAIGNTFSLNALPASTLNVNNFQNNGAINVATANLTLANVAGDVALTTAAIGNSFTVSGGN
jgi:predicted transglutaminase-like protease